MVTTLVDHSGYSGNNGHKIQKKGIDVYGGYNDYDQLQLVTMVTI
jgi:hypothetical protein